MPLFDISLHEVSWSGITHTSTPPKDPCDAMSFPNLGRAQCVGRPHFRMMDLWENLKRSNLFSRNIHTRHTAYRICWICWAYAILCHLLFSVLCLPLPSSGTSRGHDYLFAKVTICCSLATSGDQETCQTSCVLPVLTKAKIPRSE